jgi:hypothetical protein
MSSGNVFKVNPDPTSALAPVVQFRANFLVQRILRIHAAFGVIRISYGGHLLLVIICQF